MLEFICIMFMVCAAVGVLFAGGYLLHRVGLLKEALCTFFGIILFGVSAITAGHAEKVGGVIAGIDFRNGEVYAITKSGDIFSWFEDNIDIDDVLYGEDIVFDADGEHIRLGCKISLEIVDGRVEGRKLTGFIKKTQRVYELSFDGETIIGYASDPQVAAYLMVSIRCGIKPVEMVY